MFIVQTLYKNKFTGFWYEKTSSLRTDDISTICGLFVLLNEDERVLVKSYGTKEDLELWLEKSLVTVFLNTNVYPYGYKKTTDIRNLYDFLSILYAEQTLGGLKCLDVLFERYER